MARDREYEKQARAYTRFIVQNGKAVGGWEYPEDAKDELRAMKDEGRLGDAKIVARASLAKYGIDPKRPFAAASAAKHESGGNPYFYVVYQGKIGRVVESRRDAEDIARSDYEGVTRVVGRGGLRGLGLDPDRPSDWTSATSRSRASAAKHESGGNPRTSYAFGLGKIWKKLGHKYVWKPSEDRFYEISKVGSTWELWSHVPLRMRSDGTMQAGLGNMLEARQDEPDALRALHARAARDWHEQSGHTRESWPTTRGRRMAQSPSSGEIFVETPKAEWTTMLLRAQRGEGPYPLPSGHVLFRDHPYTPTQAHSERMGLEAAAHTSAFVKRAERHESGGNPRVSHALKTRIDRLIGKRK